MVNGQPFYLAGFNAPRLPQWAFRSWPGDRAAVDGLIQEAARCERAGHEAVLRASIAHCRGHAWRGIRSVLPSGCCDLMATPQLASSSSSAARRLGFSVGRVPVPGEGPDLRVPSERALFEPYGDVWLSLQPAAAEFDEAAFEVGCCCCC